jgi:hypothetical protein
MRPAAARPSSGHHSRRRDLPERLSQHRVALSSAQAPSALHNVGLSVLDFVGEGWRLVSDGGRRGRWLIQALGIASWQPGPG